VGGDAQNEWPPGSCNWLLVVIHEKGWQWALPLFFFLVEFEVALGNGLLQHMERTSGQERFSFSLYITCRKTMWI
jgi:hypothetical protein